MSLLAISSKTVAIVIALSQNVSGSSPAFVKAGGVQIVLTDLSINFGDLMTCHFTSTTTLCNSTTDVRGIPLLYFQSLFGGDINRFSFALFIAGQTVVIQN